MDNNYSYASYPDSGDSSPRSREIDCENASWDEPANYRVKFMCSYGGKISPRPHDNQLSYVGGDTKILTVDRTIRFPAIMSKLASLVDSSDICFKYQLPGEDLDALISVTNDEDLDHMMLEYDRLYRASAKPARLRLFLFPITISSFNAPPPDPKSDRQWFVDALNSAPPIQSIEVPSPPASAAASAASNPDFLFGFDKAAKLQEPPPELPVPEGPPPAAPAPIRLEPDRQIGVDPISSAEIQRQIQELQRMQIQQEQQARAFPGDFYPQKPQEKAAVAPPLPPHAAPIPVPMPMPASYWTERQMQPAPPPAAVTIPPAAATCADQQVYLVQAPVYRPQVPPGQGYYVQRMMPEMYREAPPPPQPQQQMYSMGPPPPQKLAAYGDGMVRPQVADSAGGGGYTGMAYDSAGRQVYYTSAPGGVVPPYQVQQGSNVDVRQMPAGAVLSQEGKVSKPPQPS